LRRANFDSIRQEQDLVCDFDTFPKMIADFVNDLQRCSSSAYVKGTIADDKSTFRSFPNLVNMSSDFSIIMKAFLKTK
uniref:SAS-6_N domain-containing protein n=1 Tax=Anisakis simplex TaxID=6269 RepID=A0A0M3JNF4_ANISI